MAQAHDFVVIGSGPGGCAAALTAARRGLRVGLIEREQTGGVCLNVGCIPTKALLSIAHLIRRLTRAPQMGVKVSGYELDYATVRARNERIVLTLRRGLADVLRREGIECITGSAAFETPHRLIVTQEGRAQPIEAERIVVATGGRPQPGPWTFDEQRILSYRGLLARATVPSSLLIIGGGVIGCEFASCFAAFGTQVTLIEQQAQLLPTEDSEAVRWLAGRVAADGVKVLIGARVQQLVASRDGVAAVLSDGVRHEAECCLVAVGIQPNIESLNLAAAGVACDRGVRVDEHLRTSQPHIAAIGDCLKAHGLAHWASAEGASAVRNLLDGACESLPPHHVPRCIFTDPEIAHIGPLESACEGRVRVSRFSFGALGKSYCDDEPDGFVKLLVDQGSDRVRGATIVGANASSLIHYVVLAVHHGLTAKQLARTITAHPTMPEAVTEAAAHVYGESLAVASRASRNRTAV